MSRWKPDAEGRLGQAALALFDRQGYDATTVAQIAEAAGLTKRTFFRYFSDKREVLFKGSHELEEFWVGRITAAPPDAGPMTAVSAGFDSVAAMFVDRHRFASIRSRILAANSELQERELGKLQSLAAAVQAALVERGLSANAAILAAQASVTVFHIAFDRWVHQDDPTALRRLLDETLTELRVVTAR